MGETLNINSTGNGTTDLYSSQRLEAIVLTVVVLFGALGNIFVVAFDELLFFGFATCYLRLYGFVMLLRRSLSNVGAKFHSVSLHSSLQTFVAF